MLRKNVLFMFALVLAAIVAAPSMFAQGPAIAVIATSVTSVTPTSVYISGQATGNTTIEGNVRIVYGLKAHANYWQWDNWALVPTMVTADAHNGPFTFGATISRLTPGTQYFYQVSPEPGYSFPVASFTTPTVGAPLIDSVVVASHCGEGFSADAVATSGIYGGGIVRGSLASIYRTWFARRLFLPQRP